jgi:hypothetical protein
MKTLLLVPLFVMAAASLTSAQPSALYYDASANRTCAISQADFDMLTMPAPPVAFVPTCLPARFNSEGQTMWSIAINRGRFGASYNKIACSVVDLGTGILEPRGLADVPALSLSSLGTPVPHGGRLPSAISVAPLSAVTLLQQLLDPAQMNQPRITLIAQHDELELARITLDRERQELENGITQVRGPMVPPPGPASCAGVSGSPAISTLSACVTTVQISLSAMAMWNSVTFDSSRREVETRVRDLATLKSRIDAFSFASALERYENELAQLEAKYNVFRQNLSLVQATITSFTSPTPLGPTPLSVAFPASLSELQKAEAIRQLKTQYAKVLEEDQINEIVDTLATALATQAFRTRLAETAKTLLDYATDEMTKGEASTTNVGLRQKTAAALRTSAMILRTEVASLNAQFGGLFATINNVYFTQPDLTVRTEALSAPIEAGRNGRAHCTITPAETFKPYRFDASVSGGSGTQALVLPGVTQPLPGSASADPSQAPSNNFTFEVHRVYRAIIVGGFVFSSLPKQSFAVVTRERTKSDGSKESVLLATRTDNQRPSPYYLLGFNYYFKPRDSFRLPGQNQSDWTPGVLFGVGITDSKQFFVGPNFEPTLGIDLSFGLHYGERRDLIEGVRAEVTALPSGTTEAPTRMVLKPAFYFMFGLDVNLFRRFLGQLAPQ